VRVYPCARHWMPRGIRSSRRYVHPSGRILSQGSLPIARAPSRQSSLAPPWIASGCPTASHGHVTAAIASTRPSGSLVLVDTRVRSPFMSRVFNGEFKQYAVRLVKRSGRSRTQVSGGLGISYWTLRNWCKDQGLARRSKKTSSSKAAAGRPCFGRDDRRDGAASGARERAACLTGQGIA
jgi:transposase-like protein